MYKKYLLEFSEIKKIFFSWNYPFLKTTWMAFRLLASYPPYFSPNRFLDEFWRKFHTWGRILGRNSDKSVWVFLLAIHSFALKFIFLQTHATSYVFLQTHATFYVFTSCYSSVTVHCKGKRSKKPDRQPYPLPYGLRNPYRKLERTLKIMPRNLNGIVRSWIWLLYMKQLGSVVLQVSQFPKAVLVWRDSSWLTNADIFRGTNEGIL